MWLEPFAMLYGQDLLIVAGVIVLLFGSTKLPQLAKGLGEGIREFKKSVTGEPEASPTPVTKTVVDETPTVVEK